MRVSEEKISNAFYIKGGMKQIRNVHECWNDKRFKLLLLLLF